ncbi:MAG: META domain-containing protein [Solirubrobacterales bacterium]|nr:META domain-containing protein [Solirubrobacterales bacterium]MCB0861737.1 META domain-containing protein [Solirubrobacterales bacterium]
MTTVRRALAIFLVLALGAGVVACGSGSDDSDSTGSTGSSKAAAEIDGVTWTLLNIASHGAATSLPNTVEPPTLKFDDGQVEVFGGCNNGSGSAKIGETTIDFGPIAMTKKSCGNLPDQIETYVSKVLRGDVPYELSQGNLVVGGKLTSLIYTKD